MIYFTGLSHINIVVDSIDSGIEYYKEIFNAVPLQIFPRFRNIGFSKSAGFMEKPEDVDVSIAFLQIPDTAVTLELMEYHSPQGVDKREKKLTNQIGNVGHIALKVNKIEQAFEFLKSSGKVDLISDSPEYRPFKISEIKENEFRFFDPALEGKKEEKKIVCDIVGQIKYFYFIDKYGLQWELEQGHTDLGDKAE